MLCVHGDVLEYPSAETKLEIDGWENIKVALIPDGSPNRNDFDLEEQSPNLSLAVTTRSQSRQMSEKQMNPQVWYQHLPKEKVHVTILIQMTLLVLSLIHI